MIEVKASSQRTIANLLADGIAKLNAANVANPSLDAQLLLGFSLNVSREVIIGYPEREVGGQDVENYYQLLARRQSREPLSHILGRREFWDIELKVTADVLDPRPDSESIIELVLEQFKDNKAQLSIADLGVGSGCLLLSLLKHFPNAKGMGIDRSEKAISVANENAHKLGLASRTSFVVNYWLDGVSARYDLVISNPPYIRTSDIGQLQPEVALHEPHMALDGGEDGLMCYRYLAKQLPHALVTGGVVVFEFGQGQGQDIKQIMEQQGLQYCTSAYDLAGIERGMMLRKQ